MANHIEEICITGSGSELQGVGRLPDGRAVFVPGALPGERVRAAIVRSAKRYCEARLVEVLEPSPDRRAPDCPHYGVCGGCQARHMTYAASLAQKRRRVRDALTRIGGIDAPEVRPTIGCGAPDRTRNKAEFPVGRDAAGRLVVGAHAAGSRAVVPLDDCPLQKPAAVRALRWLAGRLDGLACAAHLTNLVTRVNRAGALMAVLCADAPIEPAVRALVPEMRRALPELVSVYFLLQNRRPAHALDGRCVHLWGARTLDDELCGLTFALSPQSFFQVNAEQAERLYEIALDAAGLPRREGARIPDPEPAAPPRDAAQCAGAADPAPCASDGTDASHSGTPGSGAHFFSSESARPRVSAVEPAVSAACASAAADSSHSGTPGSGAQFLSSESVYPHVSAGEPAASAACASAAADSSHSGTPGSSAQFFSAESVYPHVSAGEPAASAACASAAADSSHSGAPGSGAHFLSSESARPRVSAGQPSAAQPSCTMPEPGGARILRVLDAYCGVGTIALAAARRAHDVLGVEIVAPAIADACQNARRNGLSDRARFVCADAAEEIPRRVAQGERFDAVILDPPRKGADEKLLRALLRAAPPRIVYVSCDPATLARDVRILSDGGYRFNWAQPVDMFPWTGHVETIALLQRATP